MLNTEEGGGGNHVQTDSHDCNSPNAMNDCSFVLVNMSHKIHVPTLPSTLASFKVWIRSPRLFLSPFIFQFPPTKNFLDIFADSKVFARNERVPTARRVHKGERADVRVQQEVFIKWEMWQLLPHSSIGRRWHARERISPTYERNTVNVMLPSRTGFERSRRCTEKNTVSTLAKKK